MKKKPKVRIVRRKKKRAPKAVPKTVKKIAAASAPTPPPSGLRMTAEVIGLSKIKPKSLAEMRTATFAPYAPPAFIFPEGKKPAKMAMDEFTGPVLSWAQNNPYGLAYSQGYTFLGYQALAEMAQVPEYRIISEVIATDMTRKWIKVQSAKDEKDREKGGKGDGNADKIKELEDEFVRLKVQECFREIAEHDGFFGRAHLYIDTGDTDDRKELQLPIANADGDLLEAKVQKGSVKALRVVEPVWCYPSNYNANNPLKADWYNPLMWFCMGTELHRSRLLTFVGREVPDLLKPAFSFGGLAMTQMAKPYVDNWLQTRQSVSDLIHSFSIMVLKTDLSTMMQTGASELFTRADLFNNLRDNRGLMMVNKDTEDFANVSAPLGSLDKLQAQSQEHICAVSRIPLVKFTGISPTGLNASSEGEIAVYDDTIHAHQEKFFRPHLTTVFYLAQINIWGKIDDDLSFVFEPLRELTELENAQLRQVEGQTANEYIDRGVLSPEEQRLALARDPDAPYASIDVGEVPVQEEPLPKNVKETERVGEGEEGENKPEPKAKTEDKKEAA